MIDLDAQQTERAARLPRRGHGGRKTPADAGIDVSGRRAIAASRNDGRRFRLDRLFDRECRCGKSQSAAGIDQTGRPRLRLLELREIDGDDGEPVGLQAIPEFRRGGRQLMLSLVEDGRGYAGTFDVGLRMD